MGHQMTAYQQLWTRGATTTQHLPQKCPAKGKLPNNPNQLVLESCSGDISSSLYSWPKLTDKESPQNKLCGFWQLEVRLTYPRLGSAKGIWVRVDGLPVAAALDH